MTVLLHDFFNKFLRARVTGGRIEPSSRHRAYIDSLGTLREFVPLNDLKTPGGIPEHMEDCADLIRMIHGSCSRYGISLKHPYCQELDIRMYLNGETHLDWCLGITSYWLKKKMDGVDLFPFEIYMDMGLRPEGSFLFGEKILLEFLTGDQKGGPEACLVCRGDEMRREPASLQKAFYNKLTQGSAPHGKGQKDLFYVSIDFEGKSHAIGLDFESNELFDPTYGIFTPKNGNREPLLTFLFHHFKETCYVREIETMAIYRVPAKSG